MAKKPHSDAGAHSEAPKEEAAKSADPRARIVDALLTLAGERTFEDITIRDVCAAANVSLADFRDLFVSKGAVLAAFSRRIDRAVLAHAGDEMAAEAPRERLFDVLMRRFDAMAPYRAGLREVAAWARRDPIAAVESISSSSIRCASCSRRPESTARDRRARSSCRASPSPGRA